MRWNVCPIIGIDAKCAFDAVEVVLNGGCMGTRRHFELLLHLFEHGTTTASDLAEALCVSARTIRRDVIELESKGIPIGMTRGKGGGVYLASDNDERCDDPCVGYFENAHRHLVLRLAAQERAFVERVFGQVSFEEVSPDVLMANIKGALSEEALRSLVGRCETVFVESPIDVQAWLCFQARRAAGAYEAAQR